MHDVNRFNQLAETFESVRDLCKNERDDYLLQLRRQDPDLAAKLTRLFELHERGGVLDETISQIISDAETTPDRVGCFRITGELGRGGMGVVYRAEQTQPKREVALKVLRRGVDSAELRNRFEFESAALARLKHPNIATIYEVGTGEIDGLASPYISMELINGVTADIYLQKVEIDLEMKLRLMISICSGVQHAHQKGIIHRDLKPQNILIDSEGIPKILDFGVARPIETDSAQALYTQFGDLVGTLAYMSPEQADSSNGEIDIRTDVYALGVMLYEMITGCMPYKLSGSSISESTRTITHTPPVPLKNTDRVFHDDLNTIVLKALRKEPSQRYQSVSELSADLNRFLCHEPISARQATLIYILRRYTRRHRSLVAFVSTLALTGVVALAIIFHQSGMVRAETSTRQEVGAFLKEMLTSLDPEKTAGEELTVRQMLDDASVRLGERFERVPAVRGELQEVVGNTYHKLGEYQKAQQHLELAISDLTAEFGRDDKRTLSVITSLGLTLRQLGELERAERLLAEVIGKSEPDTSHGSLARVNIVTVLSALGRNEEALSLSSENYRRLNELRGADAQLTLVAQNNYGTLLLNLNRHDEALGVIEDNLSRRRAVFGDNHPDTIVSLSNLSSVYGAVGRHREGLALAIEAADLSERVLGVMHLKTLVRRQKVIIHHLNSDLESAVAEGSRLVKDCRAYLRTDHPELIGATEITVTAMAFSGDIEGARVLAHELHEGIVREVPGTARSAGRAAYLLYNLYDEIGDSEEAARWMRIVEQSEYTP
jgi:serine/threonine protein kinase/tetratricopeptide (TPR) repeat protein